MVLSQRLARTFLHGQISAYGKPCAVQKRSQQGMEPVTELSLSVLGLPAYIAARIKSRRQPEEGGEGLGEGGGGAVGKHFCKLYAHHANAGKARATALPTIQ